MLTLIKREIRDHLILFTLPLILTAFYVVATITPIFWREMNWVPVGIPMAMYTIFVWILLLIPVLLTSFGAHQMYSDKNKKISALLSTQATTRNRILIAKFTTGLLLTLIIFIIIVFTNVIALKLVPRLIPTDNSLLSRMFIVSFLCSFACYCLGLNLGWNTNRFFPILGSVLLSAIIITMIIIKGFGVQTCFLLLLIIVAACLRMWNKFMTTAL